MEYTLLHKKLFRESLKSAFQGQGELEVLAHDAGLHDVWRNYATAGNPLEIILINLINDAAADQRLLHLLQTALDKRGKHSGLQRVKERLEPLAATLDQVSFAVDPGVFGEQPTDGKLYGFEKVLFRKSRPFEEIDRWLENLTAIKRAVCRIEWTEKNGRGFGSGFLVGADLVLTNWHVAEKFWEKNEADNVIVRFDCVRANTGEVCNGQPCKLAKDWNLPYSLKTELDFALLRLEPGSAEEAAGHGRKPLELAKSLGTIDDEALLILQYPQAAPLQLALGANGRIEQPRYLHYRVNTDGGSSGAPCLTQDLLVVALHHYGAQTENRGILASAIWPQIEPSLKAPAPRGGRTSGLPSGSFAQPAEGPLAEPEAEVVSQPPAVVVDHPPAVKRRAFVVQPIGEPKSELRVRADRVWGQLISKVCDDNGFEPKRAHELSTASVTEPIVSALSTDPLVIADLGPPPWNNANVMIETGFRLATGRPIIFLADSASPPQSLPLHLQNRRVLYIDPAAPGESVEQLEEYILECRLAATSYAWESQYPYVDFRIALNRPEDSIFVYANEAAARFYGLTTAEDMIGKLVADIDARMVSYMPDEHRTNYDADQTFLLGAITRYMALRKQAAEGAGDLAGASLNASAQFPIWFTRHPLPHKDGQVYCPILVQHKYDAVEHSILMRVVFFPITEWAARPPKTRPSEDRLEIPGIFRESASYRYDLSLCYDLADSIPAMKIRDLLTSFGFAVWPGDDARGSTRRMTLAQATRALADSQAVAVLIGAKVLGRWGQEPFDEVLRTHIGGKRLFFIPLVGRAGWDDGLPGTFRRLLDNAHDIACPELDAPADTWWRFIEQISRELLEAIRGRRERGR